MQVVVGRGQTIPGQARVSLCQQRSITGSDDELEYAQPEVRPSQSTQKPCWRAVTSLVHGSQKHRKAGWWQAVLAQCSKRRAVFCFPPCGRVLMKQDAWVQDREDDAGSQELLADSQADQAEKPLAAVITAAEALAGRHRPRQGSLQHL